LIQLNAQQRRPATFRYEEGAPFSAVVVLNRFFGRKGAQMPDFDVIVVGSGMGGMSCAAALARTGHKVLLLEQYSEIGGQSISFSRDGFSWDVGLHYVGGLGPGEPDRAVLDWLSEGRIEFAPIGPVYDTVHFPGGFTLPLSRPEAAQRLDLKHRFPNCAGEIDAWFKAMSEGAHAMRAIFQVRSMPEPFASAVAWWNRAAITRWCGRTLSEVIADTTNNPHLGAVLGAQWGDSGGRPGTASFGIHALAVGSYLKGGAWYPVGGSKNLADHLLPTIKMAGGTVRAKMRVTRILIEDDAAVGVETADGTAYRAKFVVSDIGARETVARLLPPESQRSEWSRDILSFGSSLSHFSLFLGFEGDIEAAGASRSNHWIYNSWATDRIWTDLVEQPEPPGMFVSFASLKDPAHDPGLSRRHAGEITAWADWSMVERWADLAPEERGPEYATLKSRVEAAMVAGFARQFPRLAPMIVHRNLATPLATAGITGHERGSFMGIENSPRRAMSRALRMKTPISGLYLSGQDVVTPGIFGAMWGGMLAAASIDPRIFQHLHG
jgi:all-trans-retinol 13,14-reductase